MGPYPEMNETWLKLLRHSYHYLTQKVIGLPFWKEKSAQREKVSTLCERILGESSPGIIQYDQVMERNHSVQKFGEREGSYGIF